MLSLIHPLTQVVLILVSFPNPSSARWNVAAGMIDSIGAGAGRSFWDSPDSSNQASEPLVKPSPTVRETISIDMVKQSIVVIPSSDLLRTGRRAPSRKELK